MLWVLASVKFNIVYYLKPVKVRVVLVQWVADAMSVPTVCYYCLSGGTEAAPSTPVCSLVSYFLSGGIVVVSLIMGVILLVKYSLSGAKVSLIKMNFR